jgi:hypothetical protein
MTASYITEALAQKIANFDAEATAALVASLGAATSESEILTGSTGSIIADIAKPFSLLAFTGTKAFTLPDGDRAGLRKTFMVTSAGSTPVGTLTVTTPIAGQSATHVFDTAGQSITLLWDGSAWRITDKKRVGGAANNVVVGTTVLTGYDMWSTYNLSITGTVSSTTTRAIPDGSVEGETIWIRCSTAASIPAGSIGLTAKTLAGVAATAAAVNATTDYELLRWDGTAWQEILTSSVTLS